MADDEQLHPLADDTLVEQRCPHGFFHPDLCFTCTIRNKAQDRENEKRSSYPLDTPYDPAGRNWEGTQYG
jgi:hypothetical protein